jgi:hypothetical protein
MFPYIHGRVHDQKISSGTWGERIIVMKDVESCDMEYDTNKGTFTLNAGVMYRISAALGWNKDSEKNHFFNVVCTNDWKPVLPDTKNGGDWFYTPPRTDKYCLQMTSNSEADTSDVIVNGSLSIIQMPVLN